VAAHISTSFNEKGGNTLRVSPPSFEERDVTSLREINLPQEGGRLAGVGDKGKKAWKNPLVGFSLTFFLDSPLFAISLPWVVYITDTKRGG
jgi:hypothetical protein